MTKFLAPFQREVKWEYKDKGVNVVIPPKLEAAGKFSWGVAKIKINHQIQYIDSWEKIGILINQKHQKIIINK